MRTPVLSVRHLRVEFPTRKGVLVAVDDVSFDIAEGEVLGVVGESGAGKSMTGSAVIGLIEPPGRIAGGEVRLKGQRIDNLPYEDMRRIRGRRIGMIFQDPLTSLNPLYRIGGRSSKPSTPAPVTGEARKRAIELLTDVGIQGAGAHRRLSAPVPGMRQRVIALSLAADRSGDCRGPTTALDVSIQARSSSLKRLCRERGTAVMLITDMGVIAETADRAAVMCGPYPRSAQSASFRRTILIPRG